MHNLPHSLPVFLFAFAQHAEGAQLEQLKVEKKRIWEALQTAEDAGRLKCEFLDGANLDDLYWQLNRFHNRLAIFSYSGHSNHELLALEDKPTRSGNLSTILGMQEKLKLVFLNGCANAAQVQELWDKGVKAVIATRASVEDEAAMAFASAFYLALKDGKTLQQAFDTARAYLSDLEGGGEHLGVYRSISPRSSSNEDSFPWGLYVQEQDEAILDWAIPEPFPPPKDLDFRTEVSLNTRNANKLLVEGLFAGMAKVNQECAEEWAGYQAPEGETSFHDLQASIYQRFPSVLGTHIKELFTENGIEAGRFRLSRMNNVYLTFSQFITSIALADFWRAFTGWKARRPEAAISIRAAYQKDLRKLLEMKPDRHASYDYLRLLTALHYIRKDNRFDNTFPELQQFAEQLLADKAVFSAYRFLETGLRFCLREREIATAEVRALCEESERQLGILLGAGAFLVNYQLASINDIVVHNGLHANRAAFIHKKYLLRGWDYTSWDRDPLSRAAYTCNHSIVFTRDLEDEQATIWVLAPFLVDQNAFKERAKSPKIYFWQGVLPDGAPQYLHAETLETSWAISPTRANVEREEELREVSHLLRLFHEDLKPYLVS